MVKYSAKQKLDNSMVVWIVNPFDNLPLEGFRAQRYWLMAKAFAASGDRVVYWTSDFSHAEKRKRRIVKDNAESSIELKMLPTKPYPKNICFKRIFSHLKLARDWRKAAEEKNEKPDIVIASTPPLSLCHAAMEFARKNGAFFVADIMDAWPETFERILPAFMLWPLKRKARRIYRFADRISAVAKRYRELAKSYGARNEPYLAYHGIEIQKDAQNTALRKCGARLKIVYIGSMGKSYDLETLIDAVRGDEGVELFFAGSGPKEEELRRRAKDCANIKFYGYLDSEKMNSLLDECDVGAIAMFPDSCVGIPYKLADYASHRLKILESLGGETGELVAKYNAGFHYEARNQKSLADAIKKMAREISSSYDQEGFMKEFDSSIIMPRYVNWVKSEMKNAPGK